ncbi:hypothetical protein [Superficieibacter electus]|nr:hypothetical protein [Superficieibacter electus]
MYAQISESKFEQNLSNVVEKSALWFKENQHTRLSLRLVMYFNESQSGTLKRHYACILDESMECLISVLPLLANRLATRVSEVVEVPQLKIRPILSMIVYWLIQAHTGNTNELPNRDEMLDILSGILTNQFMSFRGA